MIFRSRTTKASSNVTEQKACRRSFSLLSSMSLMRTSVITTVVLLFSVAHSNATPNQEQSGQPPGPAAGGTLLLGNAAQPLGQAQRFRMIVTQGEHTTAAAAHELARRVQVGQPL